MGMAAIVVAATARRAATRREIGDRISILLTFTKGWRYECNGAV